MKRRILTGVLGYLAIATAAGVDPMTGAQVGAGLWIVAIAWPAIGAARTKPSPRTVLRLQAVADPFAEPFGDQ